MRREIAFLFSPLALLAFAAACVSPPQVQSLPRIEGRFGEPAPARAERAPEKVAPTQERAEKTLDPPPHRTRDFVKISLKFESSRATWLASESVRLKEETAAARRFGRFALEALQDGVLVERVHFDFPLLANTSSQSERLEKGLTTKTSVLFPDLSEETELFLIDEKTGVRETIPWRTPEGAVLAEPSPEAPPGVPGPRAEPNAETIGTGPNEKP